MSEKHIIPLDEIASITVGGRDVVHRLISDGVRNKSPIEQGYTKEGLNGIPREVVRELFQSGKLKLISSGSILNPTQLAFQERHTLTEEDLRFDPEFEKHKTEAEAAAAAPQPTIISPQQKLLTPEALLERFLLEEDKGKGGGGGRMH